jgi:hypothetical protein
MAAVRRRRDRRPQSLSPSAGPSLYLRIAGSSVVCGIAWPVAAAAPDAAAEFIAAAGSAQPASVRIAHPFFGVQVLRTILSLIALMTFAAIADAGPLRHRATVRHRATTYTLNTPLGPVSKTTERTTIRGNAAGVAGALAEVNAARAARGLKPFVHDPALTRAAEVCAALRAQHRIAGHTANDFAALEPGVSARAAGCGALDPSWGWGSCCTYDGYQYAGAAVVMGADNRRYMHLFVR